MSNIVPGVSLTPLCFPDITSKTTRLFATVNFGYGLNYTTGGIPAGLLAFADANTVNADGFLYANAWDENVQAQDVAKTIYTFFYVPATDKLQIFFTSTAVTTPTELTNGAVIPTYLLTDASIILEAAWNRTEFNG